MSCCFRQPKVSEDATSARRRSMSITQRLGVINDLIEFEHVDGSFERAARARDSRVLSNRALTLTHTDSLARSIMNWKSIKNLINKVFVQLSHE